MPEKQKSSNYKLVAWLIAAFIFIALLSLTLIYGVFHGYGDFNFYYEKAIELTNNTFKAQADLFYAALFPTTVLYPFILSILLKIFGTSELIPVLLNQILIATLAFFMYKFLLKQNAKWYIAIIITLIATLNPIILFYANSVNAEIPFGVLICLSFFSFSAYIETKKPSRLILTAFLLLLANLFRPLALIMFTLMLLYLIIERIRHCRGDRPRSPDGNPTKLSSTRHTNKPILSILKRILSKRNSTTTIHYSLFTLTLFIAIFLFPLNSIITKSLTGYAPPPSSYGWNLFVGTSETGKWNEMDAKIFDEIKQSAQSTTEVMTYFKTQGIERLKTNGIPKGKLDMFKTGDSIFMLSGLTNHPRLEKWLNRITKLYFYLTLLSCILLVYKIIKKLLIPHSSLLIFYLLFSISSFFLLESHSRYATSYFLFYPLIIYFALFRKNND